MVKKKIKKVKKKVNQCRDGISQLTQIEQEVYDLHIKEHLTINRISKLRRTSYQAAYKIIRRLKDKGIISRTLRGVKKHRPTFQPFLSKKGKYIRLHGLEVVAKILYKDEVYKNIFKKCNLIYIEGNTIKLHKNSLNIFINESCYAQTVNEATRKCLSYLDRILIKLEYDLKLIIVKSRRQNIKIVSRHYAEIHNELAKEFNEKGLKLEVRSTSDGKPWLLIDNSKYIDKFGNIIELNELEAVHPETSEEDMAYIKNFFNDLRDNTSPLPSEMWKIVSVMEKEIYANRKDMALLIKEIGSGLASLIKILAPNNNLNEQGSHKLEIPSYIN